MRDSDIEKCCNSTGPETSALISNRASELVTALRRYTRSLSRGKSRGFASTFLQTLVIYQYVSDTIMSLYRKPSLFTGNGVTNIESVPQTD